MPKKEPPIKVLLVDDHKAVRIGLRYFIEQDPRTTCWREAKNLEECIEMLHQGQPDVVLLDWKLPDSNGAESVRNVRQVAPSSKIVILTSFSDPASLHIALNSRVDGYLLKDLEGPDLVSSIERVAKGEQVFAPEATQFLLKSYTQEKAVHARTAAMLTIREEHVLHGVLSGKTNKEIAATLNLSEKTVRNYLSAVMGKLGCSRRTELIIKYQQGR